MSKLAQQSDSPKSSPKVSLVEATAVSKSFDPKLGLAADAAIFIGTAFAAYLLDWKAADFIWSLWIASLSTGYFAVLFAIVHISRRSTELSGQGKGSSVDPKESRHPVTMFAKVMMGLFLLGFFTVHFGGFHLVHAALLSLFVPLDGMDVNTFVETMLTSPAKVSRFLGGVIAAYWPMMVSTALMARHLLSEPMSSSNIMFVPYKSVMKIHLLIIACAVASFVGPNSFVLYASILAFYFASTHLQALFGKKGAKY